jgi:deazaflavin-dependent oxidoreductase (nitroreductase family)
MESQNKIERYRHPSWLHRLIKYLAALNQPAHLLSRYLHLLDKAVLRLSGGKATATSLLTGLPVVWLTTVGAKSGQLRKTPLVAYFEGEKVILIASNFGSLHHPAWYHNLRANPRVRLMFGGHESEYIAREALGAERQNYWQKAVDLYQGYASYQERAGARQVPVVILVNVSDFKSENEVSRMEGER